MFKNILKEALTTDNALHFILALVIYLVLRVLGVDILAAVLVSTFILYMREVTQVQAKHYENKFYRGWLLNRSLHHVMEFAFPSALLAVVAFIPWAVRVVGDRLN